MLYCSLMRRLLSIQRKAVTNGVIVSRVTRRNSSTRALDGVTTSSALDCFVWGKGSEGVLGLGALDEQRDPEIVEFDGHDLNVIMFAASPSHSAMIDSSGRVWTCGRNEYGRLGLGDTITDTYISKPILAMLPEAAVQVDVGYYHTAVVTESGALYTCGWGGHWLSGCGALGHGSKNSYNTLKKVEALDGIEIAEVACGKYHTIARTRTGKVYAWGRGEFGRLGLNSNSDVTTPCLVDVLDEHIISSIAVGSASSAAVTHDGQLFVWGKNDCGQLGVGGATSLDMFAMEGVPTRVDELEAHSIKRVACSSRHMSACTQDSRLFVWGDRQWMTPFELSTSVIGKDDTVIDVVAAHNLTAFVTRAGHLFTFGSNTACLGHGDWDVVREPTLVEAFEGRHVMAAAASNQHMGALIASNH